MSWWDDTFSVLDGAIQALVSSDAPLSDRLDAAIQRMSSLSENDFPLTIRREFTRLMKNMIAYRDDRDHSDSQADLALAIFAFYKKFMVEAWPPTIPLDRV